MFLLTLLAFGAILGYGASFKGPQGINYPDLETAEKRMYNRLRHDLVMTNVMCEGRIMYIFLKLGVLLAYLYRI